MVARTGSAFWMASASFSQFQRQISAKSSSPDRTHIASASQVHHEVKWRMVEESELGWLTGLGGIRVAAVVVAAVANEVGIVPVQEPSQHSNQKFRVKLFEHMD